MDESKKLKEQLDQMTLSELLLEVEKSIKKAKALPLIRIASR